MMRQVLVVLAMCGATASARAESTFELPPGMVENRALVEPQLAALRVSFGAGVEVDGAAFTSETPRVFLLRVSLKLKVIGAEPRKELEHLDADFVRGITSRADERDLQLQELSASSRIVDNQLVAESSYRLGELQLSTKRISAIDRSNRLHAVVIMCGGEPGTLGLCERSQRTLKLLVDSRPLSSSSSGPNFWSLIGGAALVATLLGLALWGLERAKRDGRRRRRR